MKNIDKKMTLKEYETLKKSGMLWEFHPSFTGNYNVDIKGEELRLDSKIYRNRGGRPPVAFKDKTKYDRKRDKKDIEKDVK